MFVSLRGNPFRAELDSLQADAMGVGDLPPGTVSRHCGRFFGHYVCCMPATDGETQQLSDEVAWGWREDGNHYFTDILYFTGMRVGGRQDQFDARVTIRNPSQIWNPGNAGPPLGVI